MDRRFMLFGATSALLSAGAAAAQPRIPRPSGLPIPSGLPSLPGGPKSGSGSASYDPEGFVDDAVEATKLLMVSSALLAGAADAKKDKNAIRARIDAINRIGEVGEFKAQKASFNEDLGAIRANAGDSQSAEALYDRSDAKQKKLLASAAFNFYLAAKWDLDLVAAFPALRNSVQSNPRMAMKLPALLSAGDLVGLQGRAVGSMLEPMKTLMSRGGVKPPTDAKSTKPRPVSI